MSFDPAGMTTPPADLEALCLLARRAGGHRKEAVFVEVGSWAGRTALVLAHALPDSRVFCVDHWKGTATDRTDRMAREFDPFDAFARNTHGPLFHRLFPLVGESRLWARYFPDAHADLVFIDAGHSYEECAEDIALWRDKVRPGGILCGHDFEASNGEVADLFPGVARAVRAAFSGYERHGDTIWAVQL